MWPFDQAERGNLPGIHRDDSGEFVIEFTDEEQQELKRWFGLFKDRLVREDLADGLQNGLTAFALADYANKQIEAAHIHPKQSEACLSKAIAALTKAITFDPLPIYHYDFALALESAGHQDLARQEYQRFLQKQSQYQSKAMDEPFLRERDIRAAINDAMDRLRVDGGDTKGIAQQPTTWTDPTRTRTTVETIVSAWNTNGDEIHDAPDLEQYIQRFREQSRILIRHGYRLRLAECQALGTRRLTPSVQVNEILRSVASSAEKKVAIANSLDAHSLVGVGEPAKPYTLAALDEIREIFEEYVNLAVTKKPWPANERADQVELLHRYLAFGYVYRIAEELVEQGDLR